MTQRRQPVRRALIGRKTNRGNRRVGVRTSASTRRPLGPVVRILASWFAGVLAVGGLVAAVVLAGRAVTSHDRLQVKHLDIQGTVRATEDELLSYAGVHLGDSILDLDLDVVAAGLRRHPWVDEATVTRSLPDRLSIRVSEHEPLAIVSVGEVYLADQRGRLFKRLQSTDALALPVITGLTREQVTKDEAAVARQVLAGVELAGALEAHADLLGHVDELHVDEVLGWDVVTRAGNAKPCRIMLGKQPIARIEHAVGAVRRLTELGSRPSMLWADGTKNPDRVQAQIARVENPNGATVSANAR